MKIKLINSLIKIALILVEFCNIKQLLVLGAFVACYFKFGGSPIQYINVWGIFFLLIILLDLFRLIASGSRNPFQNKIDQFQDMSSTEKNLFLSLELEKYRKEMFDLKTQIKSLKEKYEPEFNFPDLNAMMDEVETYKLKMNKRDALSYGKLLQDMVLEEKLLLDEHYTNLFISTAVDIKNIAKPEELFGEISIPEYNYKLDKTAIEVSFEQQKPIAIFFMYHLLNTAKGNSNAITEVLSDKGKKIVFDLGKEIMLKYTD